ncbi:MAG: phospho-N-acetylmuramoyl-pentapeptide-transferase, partial [Alphaproteobacteria bacterium]|nr:phospho-N-acetylmuramoyl-pentapeptide-transferase [Alphaproteobacteria bacterium]
MLYWLSFFKDSFGFLNLFRYLTFRTGAALLTAFILTLIFMPHLIRWLKSKQAEQPIRSCGPETHLSKKGTPTLGGLMILITGTLATLLWTNLANPYIWVLLFAFLGMGLTGFVDDYTKLTRHSSDGISARQKLFWQFFIAFVVCLSLIYLTGSMGTVLTVPF